MARKSSRNRRGVRIEDERNRQRVEKDESGIMGMVGKGNGKKYTGAMVMIQITRKQVKALIDLGACEMLIVRS